MNGYAVAQLRGCAATTARPRNNKKRRRSASFYSYCYDCLLMISVARFALGLELLELRALVGREHSEDALVFGVADLLHLRALRVERRLERVELRGVIRLFRRAEILAGLAHGLEERRVLLVRLLLDRLDLLFLRVRQIQLLGELLAHLTAASVPAAAPLPFVRSRNGDRRAERQNCHCCCEFAFHDFLVSLMPMKTRGNATSFPS